MSISTGSNPFREKPARKKIPRGKTAEEMEPIETSKAPGKSPLPRGSGDHLSSEERQPLRKQTLHAQPQSRSEEPQPVRLKSNRKDLMSSEPL